MSAIRRWWCEQVRRRHHWGPWRRHPNPTAGAALLRVCASCGMREVAFGVDLALKSVLDVFPVRRKDQS